MLSAPVFRATTAIQAKRRLGLTATLIGPKRCRKPHENRFGQEEAQRLGRILRPKDRLSSFYTLVSKGTGAQIFALNRQLFLVEQGY